MVKKRSTANMGAITENEKKLAKVLIEKNKLSKEQFEQFIQLRKEFDDKGKRYLGNILVDRGLVSKETLNDFFTENNKFYLKFCDQLLKQGFLQTEQYNSIMNDDRSSVNVVSVIEEQGIMTKESFTKFFWNNTSTLRLGEWLVENKKLGKESLDDALAEQNINNLENYLVYNKILTMETINLVKEKLGLL